MKLKEAIARADALRPNAIPEEQKAAWIDELDGKLAETLGVDAPAPSWPEDAVLLVPPPCDNVYELYLCAMIDFSNQETGLYANDMAVFNAAVREARAWWRRHDCPRQSGNWRVM